MAAARTVVPALAFALALLAPALLLPPPAQAAAEGVESSARVAAPAVAAGGALAGAVTVKNTGDAPVVLARVVLAARPPGGTRAGGPYLDFGSARDVALAPGESRTLAFTKTFPAQSTLGEWTAYASVQGADGRWRDGANTLAFTVGPAGGTFSKAGEALASRATGAALASPAYWGGKAWNVWSNGAVRDAFTPAASGLHRVTVYASGTAAGGVGPRMTLDVAGARAGAWSVAAGRLGAYSALVDLRAGVAAPLVVAFTNDARIAGADRNLHVDHVVVVREAPAGATLRLVASSVPRYARAEGIVSFALPAGADPFDPAQVNVTARVTTPSGRVETVPGFWYQDFAQAADETWESVSRVGGPHFRVRYAPRETGEFLVSVTVTGSAFPKPLATASAAFTAAASARPGFVRVSADGLGFARDDGRPFVPLGENLAWPDWRRGGGHITYRYYFERFDEHGMNWARVWLWHWGVGLEWTPGGGYEGLGRYHLENAWKLDRVLDDASARGIGVQLVFYSFNPFSTGNFGEWATSPWNRANGGPLAKPADVLTDATAIRYSERLMRYVAARYGASDAIMAWELWNEAGSVDGWPSDSDASVAWHARMARALAASDPARHLVTTSHGWVMEPRVASLPEIAFATRHWYNFADTPALATDAALLDFARYRKPSIVAEFGSDFKAGAGEDWSANDREGRFLRKAIWGSTLGTGRASAMTWWWDSSVDAFGLYPVFAPLADLLRGLPALSPAGERVRVAGGAGGVARNVPGDAWSHPDRWQFDVQSDGRIPGFFTGASPFVIGTSHPGARLTPTFRTSFERDVRMVFHVAEVRPEGAEFAVQIDGKVVAARRVSATGDQAVTIPAGAHTVVVMNRASQWWRFDELRFEGVPRARVFASVGPGAVAAWLEDWRESRGLDVAPSPVTDARVDLSGLADGAWRAEWRSPATGAVVRSETVTVSGGRASLAAPAFTGDVALRMTRT